MNSNHQSDSNKPFNYVLGTQTFGPKYHFTDETRLVETAQAIMDMGSNVLKCYLGPKSIEHYKLGGSDDSYTNLTDLASKEPSCQKILDMPFNYYLFWVYSFVEPNDVLRKGWTQQQKKDSYDEIYKLACFLLTKYNGSGKTFYFGQWEGDWAMMGPPLKYENEPTELAIASTTDWLNTRQAAIDAAKKDTPHENVEIYNYLEVNIVIEAMKGHKTITNSVLQNTNIDYVSYSAYDAIYPYDANLTFQQRLDAVGDKLTSALDYIESKLPPKNIPGKRVFIGEYGYPLDCVGTPQAQKEASLAVAIPALQWGCPFVLYWEIYDNEAEEGGANPKGYWMIDNKGVKQPIYQIHYDYYNWAKRFAADFLRQNQRQPSDREFQTAAAEYLKKAN
ncbi:MAG: hypothetical protein WC496_06875 [Phycisphaerae bacterium]|jgi:hypothetical protein